MGKTLNVVLLLTIASGVIETQGLPQPPSPPPATEEFCGMLPEEAINTTLACIRKLNIKELDMEHFSADGKQIDPDFDDQCLSKCVFVEAGMMTDDGEPILKAFQDDLKRYYAEKYHQYLADIISNCINLAETQFKSTGGAKSNACKFASTLSQCYAMEERKSQTEKSGICSPGGSKPQQ